MVGSIAKAAIAARRMQAAVNKVAATEAAANADADAEAAAAAQAAQAEAAAKIEELFQEAFPQFMETVWDVSVIDIAKTSKAVAKKVLLDLSVPWQIQWRRAKALELFGRIWRGIGTARLGGKAAATMEDEVQKAFASSIRR